jgi:hypothetical protein
MAKSGILTGVVAVVLGIVIGVVGLLTVTSSLAPSAKDATSIVKTNEQAQPPVYGSNG